MLAGPFPVILTGHGGGLAERIALYPLIIWLVVFGVQLMINPYDASLARARRVEMFAETAGKMHN